MSIPHNDKQWNVKTNRHRTTNGNSWGWIEGSPGNVCWSNDAGKFSEQDAEKACAEHNEWLRQQEPLDMQIFRQREEVERLSRVTIDTRNKADELSRRLSLAVAELHRLMDSKGATP